VAGDGVDVAGLHGLSVEGAGAGCHHPYAVVARVDHDQVARAVHGDPGGQVELGAGGRDAVSVVAVRAGAGHRVDGPRGPAAPECGLDPVVGDHRPVPRAAEGALWAEERLEIGRDGAGAAYHVVQGPDEGRGEAAAEHGPGARAGDRGPAVDVVQLQA